MTNSNQLKKDSRLGGGVLPRRWAIALTAAAAVSTLVGGSASTAGAAPPSVLTGHVLIYGPSLARGNGFNEATAARSLGYTVAIADTIAWKALTEADFARYDAIVVGDRGCPNSRRRYLRAATATRDRWTPAITGNVSVLGTDPVYHVRVSRLRGARRLIINGLRYATSSSATGAYLALGCSYAGELSAFTPVRLLSGFGPFTVRGQGAAPFNECPERVRIVEPSSPLVRNLEDGDLSNWQCAIHAGVDSYPHPFKAVAVHQPSSMPYLLTRPPTTAGASDDLTVFPAETSEHPLLPRTPAAPNVR